VWVPQQIEVDELLNAIERWRLKVEQQGNAKAERFLQNFGLKSKDGVGFT